MALSKIESDSIASTIDLSGISLTLPDGSVTSSKLDTNIAITGNLTVDTDTLYVDSANNRVGIGTSSPATKLHILDSTNASLSLTEDGASGAEVAYNGTNNRLEFRTGTTSGSGQQLRMWMPRDSAELIIPYDASYRSTIGVNFSRTIPETNVYARIGNGRAIDLGATTDGTSGLLKCNYQSATNSGDAANNTNRNLTIECQNYIVKTDTYATTSSSERMRITDAGNVGIGTSSPTGLLTLNAVTPTIDLLSSGIEKASILTGAGGNLAFYTGGVWGGTGVERMRITSDGNVGIGNSNPMPSESRTITTGTKTVIGDVVNDQSLFGNNIYYNSGWKYYNTGVYSAIRLQGGGITFHTGASGSAGGSAGAMDTTDLRLEIANAGHSIFKQRSTHQGSQNVGTLRTATGSLGGLEIYGGGGANAAFMAFHRPGAYASYFGLDTDNWFAVGGWSAGAGLHAFKCGAFSKTSGSFKIDHPLPELNETHNLVHSFVESPQANNIYRGKVQLVNGQATVNLDTVSTMTEGTFVALNRDIHCYTSNETDWDAVKGSVNGNILTIQCQNENSTATVSWLVIGERQDQHMYDTDWTDENGKVIVEPLKTKSAITSQVPMDEEQELH